MCHIMDYWLIYNDLRRRKYVTAEIIWHFCFNWFVYFERKQHIFCSRWNYLANILRSSGFWAAGMLSMTCLSCSDKLASSVSVILLLSGESPPGSSSALELSILGLVRVMSSLLAEHRKQKCAFRIKHKGLKVQEKSGWTGAYSGNQSWERWGCSGCGLPHGLEGLRPLRWARPHRAAPSGRRRCAAGSAGGAGASTPPFGSAEPGQQVKQTKVILLTKQIWFNKLINNLKNALVLFLWKKKGGEIFSLMLQLFLNKRVEKNTRGFWS